MQKDVDTRGWAMREDKIPKKIPKVEKFEECGEVAQVIHARLGMWQKCVLEKGHAGDHLPKGECIRHGEYIGFQCPHWPTCISAAEHTRRLTMKLPGKYNL